MNAEQSSFLPEAANTNVPRYKTRTLAPIKCGPTFLGNQSSSEFEHEDKLAELENDLSENCSPSMSPMKKCSMNSPTKKGQKPEKTYTCDVCHQIFTQISNLKRHERLHTGERPYKCERCTKTFSTHSNLKQHQQVHENTSARMKFECEVCQRTYFYQSSLNKHLKSHEKIEPNGQASGHNDKDYRSLSPKKGGHSGIFNEISTNWDDSIPSDESPTDISPTTKKLKKEATANQVGSMGTLNSDPSTTTPTPTITAQKCDYNPKEGLEDVFMSGFQRNLAKVMNTTSCNFELAKSIMDLQYLTISGNPYGITNAPIFNAASNRANIIPTHTLPTLNPIPNPAEERYKVINNQISLNFQSQLPPPKVEKRELMPVENFPQPSQNLTVDNKRTTSIEYQDDIFLSFKPRLSLELGQQTPSLDGFALNPTLNQPSVEGAQYQSLFGNDNEKNKQFEEPLFKKNESVPFGNDMIDDGFDKIWGSRDRKLSTGSNYGGFLSEIFLYQNFPKDAQDFGFLSSDNREGLKDDFF